LQVAAMTAPTKSQNWYVLIRAPLIFAGAHSDWYAGTTLLDFCQRLPFNKELNRTSHELANNPHRHRIDNPTRHELPVAPHGCRLDQNTNNTYRRSQVKGLDPTDPSTDRASNQATQRKACLRCSRPRREPCRWDGVGSGGWVIYAEVFLELVHADLAGP
jgi:hypothetical protein